MGLRLGSGHSATGHSCNPSLKARSPQKTGQFRDCPEPADLETLGGRRHLPAKPRALPGQGHLQPQPAAGALQWLSTPQGHSIPLTRQGPEQEVTDPRSHGHSRSILSWLTPAGQTLSHYPRESPLPASSWRGRATATLLSKLPRAKQSESGRKHKCKQRLPLGCGEPSSSTRHHHRHDQGARATHAHRPAPPGWEPVGLLEAPGPGSRPGVGRHRDTAWRPSRHTSLPWPGAVCWAPGCGVQTLGFFGEG